MSVPPPRPASPYKGLSYYGERDRPFFFGRDGDTAIIAANLIAARLTLVYGPSGVGKSSLLRAGVASRLRDEAKENLAVSSSPRFVVVVFPGDEGRSTPRRDSWQHDPLPALSAAIESAVRSTGLDLDAPSESLRFAELLDEWSERIDGDVLLVLDQFEEYFVYHGDEDGKGTLATELPRALNRTDLQANVLISIREDAYARLDRFKGRIPFLYDNYLRVDHLDRDSAREAIEGPIERWNALVAQRGEEVTIEPGLADAVLGEFQQIGGVLGESGFGPDLGPRDAPIEAPLLQLVLERLWAEDADTKERELRWATLERLGGARRIVETHLDAAMAALSDAEQELAARAFRWLVTPSGAKVAHLASDLAESEKVPPESLTHVLETLADARILRPVPPPPRQIESRYEIFHDVLAHPILDWRARYTQEAEELRIRDHVVGAQLIAEEKYLAPDDEGAEPGIGLCLSGGGYRAMLFHVGALWRLNEAALLSRLSRISSVSGGSIAAGQLGTAWPDLEFEDGAASRFVERVVLPLRRLASETLDRREALAGLLTQGRSQSSLIASYRKRLFGERTLQDLPDTPRFVINATNLQSGVLWRFSKRYMSDYRVGMIANPTVELASAVAASAAFQPFLAPVRLALEDSAFTPGSGADLQQPPFTTEVFLIDGGVYDNLALETVWKRYRTVLVSDGGGALAATPAPPRDWLRRMPRAMSVVDGQVRMLRKRQLISSYRLGTREGAYWGMRTDISDYALPDALRCEPALTARLASMPTRLARLAPLRQEQLINWGYAVCDAAIRAHVDPSLPPPDGFPYPAAGVG